ncbi:unnamed protein product [Polarella glacialis]|uniref:Uncharacterized protein n=1 Tax=Polarella glacialis TaxID=89957 RepID=A0A813ERL4_POLGL|nr:unnamed protein product [Polarella glacialis]
MPPWRHAPAALDPDGQDDDVDQVWRNSEPIRLLEFLDRFICCSDQVSDPLLDLICLGLMKLKDASVVASASFSNAMEQVKSDKLVLMAKAVRKDFGPICYLLADRRLQFDSSPVQASASSQISTCFGGLELDGDWTHWMHGDLWDVDCHEEPSTDPGGAFRHVAQRPQSSGLLFLLDRCNFDVNKLIVRYRKHDNCNAKFEGTLFPVHCEKLTHTSLGFASQAGHVPLVKLLLERSSDVHEIGYRSDRAYDWYDEEQVSCCRTVDVSTLLLAVQEQHLQVVQLLLRHGAQGHENLQHWIEDPSSEPLAYFFDSYVTPLSYAYDRIPGNKRHSEAIRIFDLLLSEGKPTACSNCKDVIHRQRQESSESVMFEGERMELNQFYIGTCRFCCDEPFQRHAVNQSGRFPCDSHLQIQRRAKDGKLYSVLQFQYWYGFYEGAAMYQAAETKRAGDGYGSAEGSRKWSAAK